MNADHPHVDWIIERERMLHSMYGLKISVGLYRDHIRVSAWGEGEYELSFQTASGDTIEAACEGLLKKFPDRKQRVADLREQASQLMNKAAAIERGEEVL